MRLYRLGERLGVVLSERGLTLSAAESCTGGLLSHTITNVPGSSAYFLGGVVAYANQAKERVLGVPVELLIAHGAVSDQVARALAGGARDRFGSDWGIGITGIAGPGGGTEAKPVGLVYVAVVGLGVEESRRYLLEGDRLAVKEAAAAAAFDLLLTCLGVSDRP